jgi:(2Fe-2S) ferredoxin
VKADIITRDSDLAKKTARVVVGMATCGISAGAKPVFEALKSASAGNENVEVTFSGCLGMCKLEPIVEVYMPGESKVTYTHVDADKAKDIYNKHVVGGNVCTEYLITNE